jgi:glyoxylase-like metal-dependent hydrolase (beta-lactamase superfamily II)
MRIHRHAAIAILAVAVSALVPVAANSAGRWPPATPTIQDGKTVRLSPRVYVIPDERQALVPNVGIIVGDRATLVIDAGLGPRNGARVVRELNRVSTNHRIYLTVTHFHPEHISGAQAFPKDTTFIYPESMQGEIAEKEEKYIKRFSAFSPAIAAALSGVKIPPADVMFKEQAQIDLGGETALLIHVGPAHTRGDNAVYLPRERILFAGDLVQNRILPVLPDSDASVSNWLRELDRFQAMKPAKIVPGHGEVGDVSLIPAMRAFLTGFGSRVAQLKAQGKSKTAIEQIMVAEFPKQFPGWDDARLAPIDADYFYGRN